MKRRRLDPQAPPKEQFSALRQIRTLTQAECREIVGLLHEDDAGKKTCSRLAHVHPKALPCLRELRVPAENGEMTVHYMSLAELVQAKVNACPFYAESVRINHINTATGRGKLGAVRHLLRTEPPGPIGMNAVGSGGLSALHVAVRSGHVEICRVLLEAKAEVYARCGDFSETPLHMAARYAPYGRRVELVKLLLEAKASVTAEDNEGSEGDSKATGPSWMSETPAGVAELVAALDRLSLAIQSRPAQGAGSSQASSGVADWELIREEETSQGPQSDLDRRRSLVRDGDYNSFAELIPECPKHLISGCKRLSGGGVSPEFRAKRAFEAGYWARLALAGRLAKPRSTVALNLAPRVYIILRARGLSAPTRVANASDLNRITGHFDQTTICHGFPSLAEAEAYCSGAGVDLPPLHVWN
eukprot:s3074_g12.t1